MSVKCQLNHYAAGSARGLLHRLPPRVSSDDSSGEKRGDQGLAASKETLKKKKDADKGEKQPRKGKHEKQEKTDKGEKKEKKRKDSGSKNTSKKKKKPDEEEDDEDMDPEHDPIREHEDDDDDDDHRHDETEMASQVPKDLQVSGKVAKRPSINTQKKPAAGRSSKRSDQEPCMETFYSLEEVE